MFWGVGLSNVAGKVIICDNNVSASGGGCGLKTVELSNYRVYRAKLSSYRTIEYIEQNCRVIELSSRDFKTVAISVTRAKLYRINTWFACTSPSPEAQSPAGDLASAYPPKPLLFTLLGVGACDMLEQIEKLSRYRTIEQELQNCCNIGHSSKGYCSSISRNCRGIELSRRDLKTVAISVTPAKPKNCHMLEHIEKLSRYRTIEQGLQNCRNIGHSLCSSRSRNCRGIELSSRDFKTVAISVTRAKLYCINTWFACTSPSPEAQSPAGDLASAYPPKPLLFTLLGVGAWRDLQWLWAKFHRIWAWFAPPSPAFKAQPPQVNFSIRVSSQTPTFWHWSPSLGACLRALRCNNRTVT